ncbi:ABC transporter ATP-binding protein [Caproiciproducens sp. NJN-50]|uniref:ABC transporter ATP-binding protein n=1 Tax=Acutalibacteraceae TaxID=3082771 RepID=UPI000FFE165A|nr:MULTISPECIES: ABC transporter ATP-binding protein [Acutalibacteraceae]QAT51061.1 ABC transporter ATP-binding protein [Caproiciproducens sp. NJN-50]
MEPFISVTDLTKIYHMGECEIRALAGVTLRVEKGEFLAIVGRSGSGKSTLMNIIGCLDTPSSGQYFLEGENVSGLSEKKLAQIRNRQIGFIFQSFNLIGGEDALENVELPLVYRGIPKTERRTLAQEALMQVGLGGRMHHRPAQMSGGQQQRVAIARAIAARPPIILADEPTGNLDSRSGGEVMEILHSLHRLGRTVVLITHDSRIAETADRVVRIQDGKIAGEEKRIDKRQILV